ncbi:MAG TPA: aspartate/glutamate racemase family protein [Stellaceae bacterium]|jgi:Asp/Glu/hydantoin racemase|nr:aspartate/glutamate racemase family protein [Stellaceae bacterium]
MRVALIHAVTVAMAPVHDAFARLWPEAECTDLLDTALAVDRERDGELTAAMTRRIGTLADYAAGTGAAGILFTCSAFGEAIEAAAATSRLPVLKPNEAMFEAALAAGKRIGMLATFAPSVGGMEDEFRALAEQRGVPAHIETICVEGAMPALKSGDGATHDRLLAEAAPRLAGCDAVLLAHFSTARAEAVVSAALACPVLTAPGAAVLRLKSLIA